jgi:signal transduction histidine kinase
MENDSGGGFRIDWKTGDQNTLTVINNILDFSKIESGKMELEKHPFDLRLCVEDALDLVVTRAVEKGLNLAYIIEDGTPGSMVGDVTRVRQILANLLSNAVKFTEEGEVVVTVSAKQVHGAKGAESSDKKEPAFEIHMAFTDTGIGIPQERMDRLFQSFSQVDASTTRRHGGTGLGLVISMRLTEMMGGSIWAESKEAQGSTFHTTFLGEAAPNQPKIYLRGTQPELSGKRLLIELENEIIQVKKSMKNDFGMPI